MKKKKKRSRGMLSRPSHKENLHMNITILKDVDVRTRDKKYVTVTKVIYTTEEEKERQRMMIRLMAQKRRREKLLRLEALYKEQFRRMQMYQKMLLDCNSESEALKLEEFINTTLKWDLRHTEEELRDVRRELGYE